MKGREVLFSHKSDMYITPKSLIDNLKRIFDIKLDACTTKDNPLDIPNYYSLEQGNDGLVNGWMTWTYCNPPYSQISDWVAKAIMERYTFDIRSIMLLPARTDTKWFHRYLYNNSDVKIEFLEGRLKFEGMENSAPFPSMLVIIDA